MFTATSKKLALGRRTEPRIHPLLTRAGSTRVDPTLNVSTSDVGVSMKFGFPWSVKGIRPEARHTAQEAARRAGLPLSDWLNAIILQQAATQGIKTPSLANERDERATDDLSDVRLRLDNLTRRIDQVTRSGPAAYAPKRNRDESEQFGELFARLEQRFDQFAADIARPAPPATPSARPPDLDRASPKLPRAAARSTAKQNLHRRESFRSLRPRLRP